jgi:hypothetical protein
MNKQQVFSGLIGTVLTLGVITVASAANQSWQYDGSSDTVSYAFSGPYNHNYGEADYPAKPQAGNQSWQYDETIDSVSYVFSGRDSGGFAQSDDGSSSIAMDGNLPWYYSN